MDGTMAEVSHYNRERNVWNSIDDRCVISDRYFSAARECFCKKQSRATEVATCTGDRVMEEVVIPRPMQSCRDDKLLGKGLHLSEGDFYSVRFSLLANLEEVVPVSATEGAWGKRTRLLGDKISFKCWSVKVVLVHIPQPIR